MMFANLFRSAPAPITIVSGLPRSGTSAMMQMLQAGGLPLLVDDHRPPDASNPRGYFEFAPVKRLAYGDQGWLPQAVGRVVKVVVPLVMSLPPDYRYQVILMERDIDEIMRSQQAMSAGATAELRQVTLASLIQARRWLEQQPNMRLLSVAHRQMLHAPGSVADQLADFLQRPLNVATMAEAIDPDLYRQRLQP